MRTFTTIADWLTYRESELAGQSIGFVPTMGALHPGHLSLVERSRSENDCTVVSIFINPTQFNNPDDLRHYPRDIEQDQKQLAAAGTDVVLLPDYAQLYGDNYRFRVTETEFSQLLCGASRPGHFDGVLTVVLKLLNIVRADRTYFGEKDYQQFRLIKDMAQAFFLPTAIVPCPTIREADGLATSSRNLNLTPAERQLAPRFVHWLRAGKTIPDTIAGLQGDGFVVDFVEDLAGRRYGAVFLGRVRLIDNIELNQNGE
ncbi:MAG: pantoate--beta-alanine ligase [Candidatus Neomarinimicrobiota bacterium]